MSLLSLAEAQARLIALAPRLPLETAALVDAAGRWSGEYVRARRTQPAADLSAMDGYAIRFAELPGPWRVAGESAAGAGLDRPLAPGEAARISTGAPLPSGADTILIQEDARRDGASLHLAGDAPAHAGQFVRPAGADFAEGDPLVAAGERLTPARIALAAIGGHGTLTVRRRARVLLLSTGDELVAPGEAARGVRLPASNAPMLAAMLAGTPALVADDGIVRDDLAALTDAFHRAAGQADVIVTTGGASVGDHDLVRPALEAAGASLDFWRVAMKPGKPLLAGRLRDAVVLGLPGNPVSAFVTARLFLLPLLRAAMGATEPLERLGSASLAAALPAGGSRMEFLRGKREGAAVRALPGQDSAALRSLAGADVLIVRPSHAPASKAGDVAEILDIA